MQRAIGVNMALPGIEQLYRGAMPTYSGALEGEDVALLLTWNSCEGTYGFPHHLTREGLRAINDFAQAELSAMVISGRGLDILHYP